VAGAVSAVAPGSGQLGTVVTIQGTELRGHGAQVVQVTLAGVAATIQSENTTEVVVVAAEASDVQGAVVLVADTGAQATVPSPWQYVTRWQCERSVADLRPAGNARDHHRHQPAWRCKWPGQRVVGEHCRRRLCRLTTRRLLSGPAAARPRYSWRPDPGSQQRRGDHYGQRLDLPSSGQH
jgi:hypothetical protein